MKLLDTQEGKYSMSQTKNCISNFRNFNKLRGKKYRHHEDDEHIVEIADIIDAKVYFRVDGVEFPKIVTLVLYKHDDMLYVDEVTTFSEEYNLIEPVYEYKFAVKINCFSDEGFTWDMSQKYYTIEESHKVFNAEYKILEFTKREVQNGRRYEDVK